MNNVKILVFRELMIIRNSLFKYIFMMVFLPLTLYLFFSIPLSLVLDNMKPIYMVWSSAGIWVVSSLFIVYLLSFLYSIKNCNSDLMKSVPIYSYEYLLAKYLYAIIIGTLQLIISIIIVGSLNSYYITIFEILKIYIIIFPSILMISSLSYFISILVRKNIFISVTNTFVFLFISLGFGSFIPLSKFPEFYTNIVKYVPISGTIINCQRIISNETIFFNLAFVSFCYTIVFATINLLLIDKSINNS